MRGNRGWIRILEATIAVMIVAGVMLVSYSGQVGRESVDAGFEESFGERVQREILEEVVEDADLRLSILSVEDDELWDENYVAVNEYVGSRVPLGFGYLLLICNLSDSEDHCKMDSNIYVATLGEDVFVEEQIVSAEVGSGDTIIFSPKKVKNFIWEGTIEFCRDECPEEGDFVSCSDGDVVVSFCGEDIDEDVCLDVGDAVLEEDCGDGFCVGGFCVGGGSGGSILTCGGNIIKFTSGFDEWIYDFGDECDDYDDGRVIETRGFWPQKEYRYECWDYEEWVSGCVVDPVCPVNYSEVGRVACVPPCMDTCSGLNFECGVQNVCGVGVSCGTCGVGEDCIGGSCLVGCDDSCSGFGVECGARNICGAVVNCGACGAGESCGGGVCVADCVDSCSDLGYECGVQNVCGVGVDCGTCEDYESCSGGVCVGEPGVAELVASIGLGSVEAVYDGCSYNKCYYSVSVRNDGTAAGVVGNRYVDGDLKVTYGVSVGVGGSVNLGSGYYVESDCVGSPGLTYNILIDDNVGSEIGGRSITCDS
jgi:hypothetical protein